jgi:hypothetical protein
LHKAEWEDAALLAMAAKELSIPTFSLKLNGWYIESAWEIFRENIRKEIDNKLACRIARQLWGKAEHILQLVLMLR